MKPSNSRRNILKGLGITLPATWLSPVVETVVLPVHAQTSESECLSQTIPEQTISCSTDNMPGVWDVTPFEIREDGTCFIIVPLTPFSVDDLNTLSRPNQVILASRITTGSLQSVVQGFNGNGDVIVTGFIATVQCFDFVEFAGLITLAVEDTGGTVRPVTAAVQTFLDTMTLTTGVVTVG